MESQRTKVKLGELIKVKHGYAFKGKYFSNQGRFILLTPGNFSEKGGLVLKGEKEKYYTGNFPVEYILKKGDLLIAMTDLKQSAPYLGAPALIDRDDLYLHNQRLGLIELISDRIDKGFLYWIFQSDEYRGQVKGSATGTTVRHTAPDRICKISVSIPIDINIQKKIASILHNYDLLIKNNNRRIQLLEHLAKLIYDEWFVMFKFPGHEHLKSIDSQTDFGEIPDGWEIKKLREILELVYGKGLKTDERKEGRYPVYGSSGIVGTHQEYLVDAPGIIVGRKGNVGSVFWSDYPFFPIDTVYYVRSSISLYFLFFNLKNQNFINNDAAVPGLNRNQAYSLKAVIPKKELLAQFDTITAPIFSELSTLREMNRILSNNRDLLLPKLISGKIDVPQLNNKSSEVGA